jgi:hypothetical protein
LLREPSEQVCDLDRVALNYSIDIRGPTPNAAGDDRKATNDHPGCARSTQRTTQSLEGILEVALTGSATPGHDAEYGPTGAAPR